MAEVGRSFAFLSTRAGRATWKPRISDGRSGRAGRAAPDSPNDARPTALERGKIPGARGPGQRSEPRINPASGKDLGPRSSRLREVPAKARGESDRRPGGDLLEGGSSVVSRSPPASEPASGRCVPTSAGALWSRASRRVVRPARRLLGSRVRPDAQRLHVGRSRRGAASRAIRRGV